MARIRRQVGPGGAAARLVGRRGWENENVLDLLERCTLLRGLVQEAASLPDREVASLLAGSRALLFPSFAEGYGLPLAEALAAGAPAICSDLPALREVGGERAGIPRPARRRRLAAAVLDYAAPDSRGARAQLARLRGLDARPAGTAISPPWTGCSPRSRAARRAGAAAPAPRAERPAARAPDSLRRRARSACDDARSARGDSAR